ncbi:MAG: pyruvate kinase [Xanthomonadales bacterium]|nr:pyruvate kinase [Xanthomonadales bacterium]
MPRRTKIIATLGPATDRPGVLEGVIAAGADVLRLNFSHGEPADQRRRAAAAREAAARLGREIALMADLQGPKVRIGDFAAGSAELAPGQELVLDGTLEGPSADPARVGVSYRELARDLAPGDRLLLDDGLIALRVERIEGLAVRTTVEQGGILGSRKGLSRAGGGLRVPAFGEKDRRDVALAAELEADFLALSFVRSAADVTEGRRLLRAAGGSGAIVAKVERAEAVANLAEIIEASDAVLVARGDLGVEIGDAELPGLQKKIVREATRRFRGVIVATQMLQSMVEAPIPTRAEVLDVANAVIDGADAVMLSAETATGRHPERAVAAMRRICEAAERQFEPHEDFHPDHPPQREDQAIALAAMYLAHRVPVRAIVALTESGATAQWLSRFRSRVPIYALSGNAAARRRVALWSDVHPVAFVPRAGEPAAAAREALAHLLGLGLLAPGERVLLTLGDRLGEPGGTNTLKLLAVGTGEGPIAPLAGDGFSVV